MSDSINVPGLLAAQAERPASPSGRTLVTVHDGRVVLHFEAPIEYAVYDALGAVADGCRMMLLAIEADGSQAQFVINLAMAMVDHVYEMRGELKPAGGALKHELIERHRRTLRDRLRVVLNSEREKKTLTNSMLSRKLVDIVLHEVFS